MNKDEKLAKLQKRQLAIFLQNSNFLTERTFQSSNKHHLMENFIKEKKVMVGSSGI